MIRFAPSFKTLSPFDVAAVCVVPDFCVKPSYAKLTAPLQQHEQHVEAAHVVVAPGAIITIALAAVASIS